MDGCIGGRWVMGTPFTQNASIALPATITFGAYESKLYETIQPVKVEIDAMVTTAAEVLHLPSAFQDLCTRLTERCLLQCATLVRRDHPTASAAEYSNVGLDWCNAVFDA